MRGLLGGAAAACLVAALGAGVPAGAAPVRLCNGLPATIVGTAGDDDIAGTDGDDVIVGLSGDDVVRSLGGNDAVCGNGGADRLWDPSGQDVLIGGDGNDEVSAGDGHDVARLGAGKDYFTPWGQTGPVEVHLGPGDERFDLSLPFGGLVDAGPGDDEITVGTLPGVPLTLTGGDGIDVVDLAIDDALSTVPVFVSQRTAALRVGNGPLGRVSGWEGFLMFGDHDWVYRGTNAGDDLIVTGGRLRAHLYGGDDVVTVIGHGPHLIDAGSGSDLVDANPQEDTCISAEWGRCAPVP